MVNRLSRNGRWRALLPRVVAAAVLVSAAGCGSSGGATGTTMDRYYGQQVEWGSCQGFSPAEAKLTKAGMQCARVTVPIDYQKLDGATAQIAISRLPATGARVASMLTNPGGPGGLGLTLPLMFAKAEVAQRFDVIGVDVRGLGASTPKVVCRTDAEYQAERTELTADHTPAGIARIETREQALVANCVQRTGLEFLGHVGTADVARDFDVIRAALGDEKLTFFGASYGSRLGSTIAELYPARVRAMVLDGGVDPAQDMVDDVTFLTGFQHAFDAYATDCAQAADCPVGTDPAQATQRFRALVNPLIEHPVPAVDDRELGYNDAVQAVTMSMYNPAGRAGITKGLTELTHGRGDTLLKIADAVSSPGFVDHDLHMAVLCGEETRMTDRTAAADRDHRVRTAAPIFDDGHGTDQAPLDRCAFWPLPVFAQPHAPVVTGLPKVVVVGTTGDPATPYVGGVNLARALGATMVTYEGVQHGVFGQGKDCIDGPVTRYLIDLTPPAEGIRCSAS